MYEHKKINGDPYVHYGSINGFSVYINEHIPQETRKKVADFLQEQGREWMVEHIGHRSDQHFHRAEPTVDSHFYRLEHPHGTTLEVLVDRN